MDDVTRHPEDATLFDMVEGSLDPDRVERVEQHLARCAACAAFVRAARAGSPVDGAVVEEFPAEAAGRMHLALSAAWRDRVAGIASAEAAHDAQLGGDAGFAPTAPLVPSAEAVPAPAPHRRGRRLVPVLAFVVLGALAGTSIYVGERGEGDRGTASVEDVERPAAGSAQSEAETADSSGQAGAGGDAAGGTSTAGPVTPGAREDRAATSAGAEAADSEAADSVGPAAGRPPSSSTASSGTVPTAPTDQDALADLDRTCVATRDETDLVLPDGRLAQEILTAPFDIFVVCG